MLLLSEINAVAQCCTSDTAGRAVDQQRRLPTPGRFRLEL
jgi:hypothetical protein